MSDLLRFQPAGTPPPVSQRLFFGTRRSIISSIASKLQQSTESARVIAEEQPSQASLMIEPSISLSSSVSTLLPTDSSSAIIEPVTDSNINITQQIVDRVAALEIEQSNQSNDAPKTIPASLAAIGLTRAASKEQFDALQTLFDGDLELSSLTLKQTELKSGSIRVQMSLAHFDIDEIHQNLDGFSRDCVAELELALGTPTARFSLVAVNICSISEHAVNIVVDIVGVEPAPEVPTAMQLYVKLRQQVADANSQLRHSESLMCSVFRLEIVSTDLQILSELIKPVAV